jgi:hypothetical protein
VLELALSPDHPWVGTAFWKVARVYVRRKAYAEAEPLLARAQRVFERSAPNHPALGGILKDHADVLARLHRGQEAREMRQRAQAILSSAAAWDRHTVDWRDLASR